MERTYFSTYGLQDPLSAIKQAYEEARRRHLQVVTLDYSFNPGQLFKDALGRSGSVTAEEFKALKEKALQGKIILCVLHSDGEFSSKPQFRRGQGADTRTRTRTKFKKTWNRKRKRRA